MANLEVLRVSIAADRSISGIIAPGAGDFLNPSMSFQDTKKDVFIVTERERYPISVDIKSAPDVIRQKTSTIFSSRPPIEGFAE